MFSLFKKTISKDLIVIDSQFPQEIPLGFRNTEINEYIKRIGNFDSYTMYPMQPGASAWFSHGYGVSSEEFDKNKKSYLIRYPNNSSKIHYLEQSNRYRAKLAYSFFLAETYVLLPFYNKNKIPFTFVLYPGGAFGLDNDSSDNMLKEIFDSKYFRNVIVTQDITRRYLIDKKLCNEEDISYIYGGFVQFNKDEIVQKKYYKQDKDTFDICFVAAKYSDKGIDKGYDSFIAVAKLLASKIDDVRFHVVGGFDETDIDVSGIKSKITFYGYKSPEFLLDFYSSMDIFLAPNRSGRLFEGSFDGFPLGIDAGYCGVALFVGDDLNMNSNYINRQDIAIINTDAVKIEENILVYYNNIEDLYELSSKGCQKTQQLFDTDYQIKERIKVFNKYANGK